METLVQKILKRGFVENDAGCLEYSGYRNWLGYGQIRHDGRLIRVHRAMFEHYSGDPIPNGFVVRHLCDNPPCSARQHLLLGTQADNMADARLRGRSYKADWTACPNGHPYGTGAPMPGTTKNRCRECARDRNHRYYQKKRAANGIVGADSVAGVAA